MQQRGILTVVNAYPDAIYAGDRDTLLATLTSDGRVNYLVHFRRPVAGEPAAR